MKRVGAEMLAQGGIVEQAGDDFADLCGGGGDEGFGGLEQIEDGAEVLVMWSGDDGDSELRGLQQIVSACRHQASADEGDSGEGVEGGEFAYRVKQEE